MRPGITLVGGSILLAACVAALLVPKGHFRASLSPGAQARSAPVASPAPQPEPKSNRVQSSTLAMSLANIPTLRTEASSAPPVRSMADRPQVDFRYGLLSIHAHDATISEVLLAAGKAMGATADLPDAANERVSVQLGPGEPAAVLTSLLSALPYDYILVGSQRQSTPIARIMLMSRSGSRGQQPVASGNGAPAQPPAAEGTQAEGAPQSNLEEVRRQLDLQFQRQFGTCIAQRCDDS
jgi:hypothetical protein